MASDTTTQPRNKVAAGMFGGASPMRADEMTVGDWFLLIDQESSALEVHQVLKVEHICEWRTHWQSVTAWTQRIWFFPDGSTYGPFEGVGYIFRAERELAVVKQETQR